MIVLNNLLAITNTHILFSPSSFRRRCRYLFARSVMNRSHHFLIRNECHPETWKAARWIQNRCRNLAGCVLMSVVERSALIESRFQIRSYLPDILFWKRKFIICDEKAPFSVHHYHSSDHVEKCSQAHFQHTTVLHFLRQSRIYVSISVVLGRRNIIIQYGSIMTLWIKCGIMRKSSLCHLFLPERAHSSYWVSPIQLFTWCPITHSRSIQKW
jgi:hypothetical protein